MSQVVRKHRSGVFYEIITRPWFGPRKRGKQLLLARIQSQNALSCNDFIEFVGINFPNHFKSVQHIRFYTGTFIERSGERWEQRFAVCSIAPDYSAREALFAEGPFITNETGWYPLIMGNRISSQRTAIREPVMKGTELAAEIFSADWGDLCSLTGLNLNESGCSLLLDFTHNSLLLDCGFSYHPVGELAPRGGILTHTHQDHSGGLSCALASGLSIVVSDGAARQMQALQMRSLDHKRLAIIQPPVSFSGKDRTKFEFLPGAHSPGSMMLLITTNRGDQILYPGDYCMANRYYQEDPETLIKLLNASGKRWLLVDGTFLGHGPRGDGTDSDKSLLELINDDWETKKTVVFVAQSLDYLYAAYIWYFQTFYTGEKSDIARHLIATPNLIRLLESTFEPFIRRRHECYDPYLRAVLKGSVADR